MAMTRLNANLQDGEDAEAGFATPQFTLPALTAAVAAPPPDTIAPRPAGGFVNGSSLVLRFTELGMLDAANEPPVGSFGVSSNGAPIAVSGLVVDPYARTVTLTLASPVAAGQRVAVSYLDPTAGDDTAAIQDAAGNDARSFQKTIANLTGVADKLMPLSGGARVDAATLVLSYVDANPLDAANPPLAGSFHVLVDGVAVGTSGVAVDANARTVTLTLASPVASGQAVSVAYADPTRGNDIHAIQDASGNDAASLRATPVFNVTALPGGDTTAPAFASANVNGATLVMSYSDAGLLDAAHVAAAGSFAVQVDAVSDAVTAVTVDAAAKTVTLTLSSAVTHGQAVTVAYTDPTGGNDISAIQDASGNDAATLVATSVANNTPASALALSSLDGITGFRLDAAVLNERIGYSVDSAGDINGDGFDDVIVGTCSSSGYSSPGGSSYVVFGHAASFAPAVGASGLDGTTGFRLDGAAINDYSGRSLAGAGDFNGDGIADLIVGAKFADPNGPNSGSSYVVFGHSSPFTSAIDLGALDGTNGFRLDGAAAGDNAGISVSAAGDVNGDGFADLIVGASGAGPYGDHAGASYIVFGRASSPGATIELAALDGTDGFRIDGAGAGDFSGRSVSAAGDVNGDGFADLIIGAFEGDPNSAVSAGASYVVFGKATGFASAINLYNMDSSTGFRIDGAAAGDYSGCSVSSAGDVNGDGFDDLIVGAYRANTQPFPINHSGSAFIVFGHASGFGTAIELSGLDGSNGFRLDGDLSEQNAGSSVSTAGDVNGDGFADLIVDSSGAAYVVFGKASGFAAAIDLSSLDGTTGFRLDTPANSFGSFDSLVSAAGDVNGDGFADLIVGEPFANSLSGAGYVVFGSNSTGAVTFLGASGADSLNAGTAAAERFVAGDGNDTMTGGGGADVFYGGAGNDTIKVADLAFQLVDGGTGSDTLALSGSGIHLTLANERGRIGGIEIIDITGSGNNTVTLTALDLLNLSDSGNTLMVKGNGGDVVNAVLGAGFATASDQVVNGATYHTYTQGAAVLLVGVNITASDIHIS